MDNKLQLTEQNLLEVVERVVLLHAPQIAEEQRDYVVELVYQGVLKQLGLVPKVFYLKQKDGSETKVNLGEKYYLPDEAAAYLGITRKELEKYKKSGKINPTRFSSKSHRYPLSELITFKVMLSFQESSTS